MTMRHPRLGILGLAVLALPFLSCEPPTGGPAFGPYLMLPSKTGIVVLWRTDVKADSTVLYGLTSAYGEKAESATLDWQHEVPLKGLVPDTHYHYKVISKLDGKVVFESEDAVFRTAPPDSEGFKFAFFGEVHHQVEAAAFNAPVLAHDPHVILDASDQVSNGHDLHEWHDYFTNNGPLWKKYALLPAFGNHNYAMDKWYKYDKAETSKMLFALPDPEYWYSVRYGNTLILALDNNYRINFDASTKQIEWLEKTLKEATDGVDDPTFKIAFFHAPPYSSGVHAWELDQTLWTKKHFIERFKKYGVDLVLNAHDKLYERSVADGITYIQVATGSLRKKKYFPFNDKYSKVMYFDDYTALLGTVTKGSIEFEAITAKGTTVDSGTLPAKKK